MSYFEVDLSASITGAGITGSPFDATQLKDSLGLTGITGDIATYKIKGKYTYNNDNLIIRRDNALLESSEKTPARIQFGTTGISIPGMQILNEGYGQTGIQTVTLNRVMMERLAFTGPTGDRGPLIAIENQGLTGKATDTHLTINNSVMRVDNYSGYGAIIKNNSTGDGNDTLYLYGNDLLAVGNNVDTMVDLTPKTPHPAYINSTYFEGLAVPLKREVTGPGDYRYSGFYHQHDVMYRNSSLINYTYVALDNTVQYVSAVDLSGVITGDTFIDSSQNPYTIINVWDGLDRLQLSTITGEIDDTAPTSFRQGSVIKEFRDISVGIGGTGGGTGAIPSGANNKDFRYMDSALEFSDNTITGMALPMAITPNVGSQLIGQGDPASGLTQDLFLEARDGTPEIGARNYRLMLNTYESMPQRDDVLVKSTINKTVVIALTNADSYFDNITELKKVEMWYVHEDGRQMKHMIHEGGPGGPLTAWVKWTPNADTGIWHKTRIKVIGFNGEDQMVRGSVINGRYEDLILQ